MAVVVTAAGFFLGFWDVVARRFLSVTQFLLPCIFLFITVSSRSGRINISLCGTSHFKSTEGPHSENETLLKRAGVIAVVGLLTLTWSMI